MARCRRRPSLRPTLPGNRVPCIPSAFRDSGAQIFVVPKDGARFQKTAQAAGWKTKPGVCFRLTGTDQVGALCDTLDRIASEGINLHAVDAIAVEGKFAAYVWSEEADAEKLGEALKA